VYARRQRQLPSGCKVRPVLRSSLRIAGVCAVLALLATGLGTVSSRAAATPTCPKLTNAQLRGVFGVVPTVSDSTLASGTVATGGGEAINCFYALRDPQSVTVKIYRGTGAFGELKKVISTSQGMNNGTANGDAATAPHCTSATAGYCDGNKYDEHLTAFSGLGVTAYDDPGGPADGANVEFTYKGNTFAVRSSGPYGVPGPPLSRVIAFAKLIVASHYTL
jgi:hypothetical protein